MATAKKPAWRIRPLRKKGERLGTVEAADAEEAIKVAIKRFGITDPKRRPVWSRNGSPHDDRLERPPATFFSFRNSRSHLSSLRLSLCYLG